MTISTDDFLAQMDQLQNQAVNTATTNIKQSFDQLKNAGKNVPHKRDHIVRRTTAVTRAGGEFSLLVAELRNDPALVEHLIVEEVVRDVQTVERGVEGVFEDIADGIESAVDAVGDFFDDLFS